MSISGHLTSDDGFKDFYGSSAATSIANTDIHSTVSTTTIGKSAFTYEYKQPVKPLKFIDFHYEDTLEITSVAFGSSIRGIGSKTGTRPNKAVIHGSDRASMTPEDSRYLMREVYPSMTPDAIVGYHDEIEIETEPREMKRFKVE